MQIDKLQKFRQRLVNLSLPRFLNPIDSSRQLILWLVLSFSIALIAINLINWLRGDYPSFTWEAFKNLLLIAVVAGLAEEVLFRGFSRYMLGNAGLVIGTILWIGAHQFDSSPPPFHRIPTDMLWGIFYLKLWRGKYWKLSFIIHPSWNIGILLWWQFVFPWLTRLSLLYI